MQFGKGEMGGIKMDDMDGGKDGGVATRHVAISDTNKAQLK